MKIMRCSSVVLLCFSLVLPAKAGSAQDRDTVFSSGLKTGFAVDAVPGVLNVKAAISVLTMERISAADENWISVSVPEIMKSMKPGAPALPLSSRRIENGRDWIWKIDIVHADSVIIELDNYCTGEKILPYQPLSTRGDSVFSFDENIYSNDSWYGGPVIELVTDGCLRGVNTGRLLFHPLHYNPVKRQLKLYYNVEAECTLLSGSSSDWSRMTPAFSPFLIDLIQVRPVREKRMVSEHPMTLVIVADTMFRDALQAFIQWKIKKGFNVIEGYTTDPAIGNSGESIRNWLMEQYTNPPGDFEPASFLLLVGDVQQIPLSPLADQNTDLYYAEYDGNGDYLPELFYGRISAQTVDQFVAVRDKILEYEQYDFPDPAFLERSVLIAGVDINYSLSHANGQINYATSNYFNEDHNIEASAFLYPASATADAEIISLVSGGAAFVNYTGHGSSDSWADPTFTKTNISQLQNEHMYPVMIGNGCQTNSFVNTECFSEAAIRANGKGALAYIGCTNDSYWNEDFYWSVGIGSIEANPTYESTTEGYYDKVFHEHGEDLSTWAPTLGEMVFAGNMSVQGSSSDYKKYYWEIYQLMGDPTLIPWFSIPESKQVTVPGIIPPDIQNIGVEVEAYDYISLSKDGKLLDAKHADAAGFANLYIPDTLTEGSLLLVVTGEKRIPSFDTILYGNSETSYLETVYMAISGESVSEDGSVSNGESFSIDMILKNSGQQIFSSDTLVARIAAGTLGLSDSLYVLPSINPGDSVVLTGAFRLMAPGDAEDGSAYTIRFGCRNDSLNNFMFYRGVCIAPNLSSQGFIWSDSVHGNGDGIINQGEMIDLQWKVTNNGHYQANSLHFSYPGYSTSVLTQAGISEDVDVPVDRTVYINLTLQVADTAKDTIYNSGIFSLGDGYYELDDSVRFVVGHKFDNFQHADFKGLKWINDEEFPWEIDSVKTFSGRYSARSGDVDDSGESSVSFSFYCLRPDSISFYYKVSSEQSYDFLYFYIDDVEIKKWSGSIDWKRYVTFVFEGKHTLRWTYAKDNSLSGGEDCAWIDEIVLPVDPAINTDLRMEDVSGPASGAWLGSSEDLVIQCRNSGPGAVGGIVVGYSINNETAVFEELDEYISPGSTFTYSFINKPDLSRVDTFRIRAFISSVRDTLQDNDTLVMELVHYPFPDITLADIYLDSVPGKSLAVNYAIRNNGNIDADSIFIKVNFANKILHNYTLVEDIPPGGNIQVSNELIGEGSPSYPSGWYPLVIDVNLLSDSIPADNRYVGAIYWSGSLSVYSSAVEGIEFWPNPARNLINLSKDQPGENDLYIRLVDPAGRIIGDYLLERGSKEIQIALPEKAGLYLLVFDDNGIKTVKIINQGY